MAGTPSPSTVYNTAQSGASDPRTPGTNDVVNAWKAWQDFTGPGGVTRYNYLAALTRGIREVIQ